MSDPSKNDVTQADSSADSKSSASTQSTRRRWYRRPKVWILILLGCFFINLLLSAIPAFWSDKATSYTRDEDGELIAEDGSKINLTAFRPLAFDFRDWYSAHGNGDRDSHFREVPNVCRRIAIFNLSTDPQMQVVAQSYIKELGKNHPTIERIDYYPAGRTITPDSLLPDLYVYLNDTPYITARMLPGTDYHELQSPKEAAWSKILQQADFVPGADFYHKNVSLLCGTNPLGMGMIPADSLTAPRNNYFSFLSINRSWRAIGLGLPILTDHWLPQQIGISLAEQTSGGSTHGMGTIEAVPRLPESFYPSFEKADLTILNLVDQFSFSSSVSGHGLMTANESVWVLKPTEDLRKKLFTAAKEQLEAAGWNMIPTSDDHTIQKPSEQASEAIFARKGNREVVIGPIPKIAYEDSMPIGRQYGHPAERDPNQDGWIGIGYRDRMSREKVIQAVTSFLVEQIQGENRNSIRNATEVAMQYEAYWAEDPRYATEIQNALEECPPRSLPINALLLLAKLQNSAGAQEKATETLRITEISIRLWGDLFKSDKEALLKQIIKDWKPEIKRDITEGTIAREELKQLGLTEISQAFRQREFVVGQNEPIGLFTVDADGNAEAIGIQASASKATASTEENYTCKLNLWSHNGGVSHRKFGTPETYFNAGLSQGLGMLSRLQIKVEPIDNSNQIIVTIKNTKT